MTKKNSESISREALQAQLKAYQRNTNRLIENLVKFLDKGGTPSENRAMQAMKIIEKKGFVTSHDLGEYYYAQRMRILAQVKRMQPDLKLEKHNGAGGRIYYVLRSPKTPLPDDSAAAIVAWVEEHHPTRTELEKKYCNNYSNLGKLFQQGFLAIDPINQRILVIKKIVSENDPLGGVL